MNSKIEKKINRALRKSSPARAWGILLFCVLLIASAVFLRFFVFSVWNFEGKRAFICELEICKKEVKKGDLLLANIKGGKSALLWLIGRSGEEIKVPTPFDTLTLSIPKKGDTVFFEKLNPMLWDAFRTLHREQFPEIEIRTEISLWSKEKELPFAFVGRASISGRPVSEREVPFLPWQELRLLELQLQRIFPAIDSIHFERKVFADSIEIESFVANEELFYISCEKPERQKLCYDSREKGFFRKSEVRGVRKRYRQHTLASPPGWSAQAWDGTINTIKNL
ncbi:MAG: hypothetical protein LBC85_11295 [Fibromonadaceae bacterium]|jgi:hypothetical protein|nr:hypothetical protein [Fibromonadaceae bacterium]